MKQFLKKILPPFLLGYYRNSKEFIPNRKRRKFYSSFIKKHDLCFDVGANSGNRISPLLKIGAKVLAIEPQEQCVSILKQKFGKKINIVSKGLGEKNEIRNFFISENSVLSTFSDDFISKTENDRFSDNTWNEGVKIEITTLDNLINDYGIPHFIKIDVEGFEFSVLKGLNTPVNWISFEFIFPELTQNATSCILRLIELSSSYLFNYSEGESMDFVLEDWVSADVMLQNIKQNGNSNSWGDIYAKLDVGL